jgi:hypothetical protein
MISKDKKINRAFVKATRFMKQTNILIILLEKKS